MQSHDRLTWCRSATVGLPEKRAVIGVRCSFDHNRPFQRSRWPTSDRNLIFSRMIHRATAATSLQTRPVALPRNRARWPAPRLPKLVGIAFVLLAPSTCSPRGETTPHSPSCPIEIRILGDTRRPLGPFPRALADAASPHFNGQRVNVMTLQGGAGAAGMQYMPGRAEEPSCARRVHG